MTWTSAEICDDCGHPIACHCTVYPVHGEAYVQCPAPFYCVSITRKGTKCTRYATVSRGQFSWCRQHTPEYVRESMKQHRG